MRLFLKLFFTFFLTFTILLSTFLYFSNKSINSELENNILSELKSKTSILCLINYQKTFDPLLHQKILEISKQAGMRITIIETNGKVLDDSFLEKERVEQMDNHKNRPEVIEATTSAKEEGISFRKSETMKQEMFYYAKFCKDKNIIIRVAYPSDYIENLSKIFKKENISLYFFLISLIFIVSLFFAKKISSQIIKLDLVAEELGKENQNILFPEFKEPTMSKLSGIIYKIYNTMKDKNIKLKYEQEKLNLIFSILEQGMILLEKDNTVVKFNSKVEKYLNINIKEKCNFFDSISNNYELLEFFDILNSSTDKILKKLLDKRIFEIYLKFIGDQKLIVFYDITEREQYIGFKHQLIENISHELKTPISTIMGYAETLIDNPNIKKEIQNNFLNGIYKNSKVMIEIIDDIIEIHKLETLGKIRENIEEFSIDDILNELKDYYLNCSKQINFTTKISKINIIDYHLLSVMKNLIDNAVKYSEGNTIDVEISRENEESIVRVSDEGPIIPKNERERIFERFYTVSKSRNKDKSGSGLGLSIVKHIANLYKGEVKLYTNSKRGNTFEVSFKI